MTKNQIMHCLDDVDLAESAIVALWGLAKGPVSVHGPASATHELAVHRRVQDALVALERISESLRAAHDDLAVFGGVAAESEAVQ